MSTFRRSTVIAIFVITSIAVSVSAQQACPCVPVTKLWVTKVCDTFGCASSEFATANGDPTTMVLPAGSQWVIVRQVPSGGFVDNSPYTLESFDNIGAAGARYDSITADHNPLIVSGSDGKLLVISLKEVPAAPPHRRAAR